jgi:hypothetical protein
MHQFLRALFGTLRKLSRLPRWLDWLLSVVEPLVVLAITVVIFYIGYWVVFGPEQNAHQMQFKELIKEVDENWKAGLLLLLLLFYRTVRVFLEQAEEAFGVKKKTKLAGEAESAANPRHDRE